jgi:hypothetical protein
MGHPARLECFARSDGEAKPRNRRFLLAVQMRVKEHRWTECMRRLAAIPVVPNGRGKTRERTSPETGPSPSAQPEPGT